MLYLPVYDVWQAVHSGADLESAIQACMGYTAQVGALDSIWQSIAMKSVEKSLGWNMYKLQACGIELYPYSECLAPL